MAAWSAPSCEHQTGSRSGRSGTRAQVSNTGQRTFSQARLSSIWLPADIQPLLGVAKPGEGVLLLAHLAEGVHTGIAVTGFHESLLQAAIAGRVGQSKVDCF